MVQNIINHVKTLKLYLNFGPTSLVEHYNSIKLTHGKMLAHAHASWVEK